jgi:hypothetical protein
MTTKLFFDRLAKSEENVVQIFIDLLTSNNIDYCLVGGLAVNSYVDPVVSLDMDLIVAASDIDKLKEITESHFSLKGFEHSLNLKSPKSNLRIQIQTDPRYQSFIKRANFREVMGYQMKVAALEDVLQGKVWAYLDESRRKSKRQKDLADIFRLVEAYPELTTLLPKSIKTLL